MTRSPARSPRIPPGGRSFRRVRLPEYVRPRSLQDGAKGERRSRACLWVRPGRTWANVGRTGEPVRGMRERAGKGSPSALLRAHFTCVERRWLSKIPLVRVGGPQPARNGCRFKSLRDVSVSVSVVASWPPRFVALSEKTIGPHPLPAARGLLSVRTGFPIDFSVRWAGSEFDPRFHGLPAVQTRPDDGSDELQDLVFRSGEFAAADWARRSLPRRPDLRALAGVGADERPASDRAAAHAASRAGHSRSPWRLYAGRVAR